MKHFFYILILMSFVGCNKINRPKKPKDLIAKEKMSDIMYDLYILNAAKGVNKKVLELNGIMPSEYIYKKYDIDSLQFAESNTYYAYDTKTYSALVEKIKSDLEKDKELYEKLTREEQRMNDSLRKVSRELKVKDSTSSTQDESVD
ncbi:DUF4296 domain-containing protein [Gelidibacter maritimus]|uniref:DUF4296 domain-containing protein n=1 Tax=Gelidibacter maritimus TaxID=2761487 RepID=A0A7W2M2R1_9FLAO|nr:DUF4296 domain-containing protein [Gelidibacter maritimus]MBA6151598.1 DUF4296 domain-containing protein [Gelidibacter maritimus]